VELYLHSPNKRYLVKWVPVSRSFENGGKPSGSVEEVEFLDSLNDCWLLRKDSASWSWFSSVVSSCGRAVLGEGLWTEQADIALITFHTFTECGKETGDYKTKIINSNTILT